MVGKSFSMMLMSGVERLKKEGSQKMCETVDAEGAGLFPRKIKQGKRVLKGRLSTLGRRWMITECQRKLAG